MTQRLRLIKYAAFVGLAFTYCFSAPLRAAEKPAPTEPQKMVNRLFDAVDAAPEEDETADENERIATRWEALVRQRTWTDSTGKFKTFASYLNHDPDLKWVELRVLVKGKDGPSFKTVKVPLDKLDGVARDVVKRISVARPQVEKALSKLAATDDAGMGEVADAPGGRDGTAPADDGTSGYGGRGIAADPYARQPIAPADDPAAQEAAAADQPAYVGDTRAAADALAGRVAATQGVEPPPDPSLQPGVPGAAEAAYAREAAARQAAEDAAAGQPPAATQPTSDNFAPINAPSDAGTGRSSDQSGPASTEPGVPRQVDLNTPLLPDKAAWRTDYEAFRTSLTAEQDAEGNWAPQFGEIQALAKAYALATKPPEESAEPGYGSGRRGYGMAPEVQAAAEAALDGAGDVVWEATLKTDPIGPQSPVEFDLPAPSEPFLLTFQCDDAPGDFSRYHAGDRVKFIGRFAPTNAAMIYGGPGGPIQLWIAVRFPADQGAAPPAVAH